MSQTHWLKMNPCHEKYILNIAGGIIMYQLFMSLPLFYHFQHIPPKSMMSIHFPVFLWTRVGYCSNNTDSLLSKKRGLAIAVIILTAY